MLRPSGSLARGVRRLAALVLLAGWLMPLAVPHGSDAICVLELAGDETRTPGRVDAPAAASGPEHCLVCHLARTFRFTLQGVDRVALWLVRGHLVASANDQFRRGPAVDRLPARAPPASSFPL